MLRNYVDSIRADVGEEVDVGPDVAQVILQAGTGGAEADEDEAAIVADAWHANQAHLALIEVVLVAVLIGAAGQVAGVVVGPAVVAAAEVVGVAVLRLANGGAAVATAVVHDVDLVVVRVAADDHRLPADEDRLVVATLGHFRLVRYVDPAGLKDALHLLIEDERVGKDALVNYEVSG